MIQPALTGYIAVIYGQSRYFKSFSDAKLWVKNVTGKQL